MTAQCSSQNPGEEGFVIHAVFTFWFYFIDADTKAPRCLNDFLDTVLSYSFGSVFSKASDCALLACTVQIKLCA